VAQGDKSFDATPGRIARAKREGDAPRSHDLTVAVSFGGAALATSATLGTLGSAARAALVEAASGRARSPGPYVVIGCTVAAIAVSATVLAVATMVVQAGGIAIRAPGVKPQKLDPVAGLKRMFGRDAAFAAVKAFVIALVVMVAIVPAVAAAFGALEAASSPESLAAFALGAVRRAVASAIAVALAFACADVVVERKKWLRRLRMSFDDVKRDHKQSEGDPLLRGRRRRAHRDLVRGALGRVREAAFVVANPTHVAIALAYAPPAIAVPRVLVRAVDAGALEVRRLAREAHVPIVENVALARGLLASTDVGDPIPPDAYGAVAAIVASLLREGAPA